MLESDKWRSAMWPCGYTPSAAVPLGVPACRVSLLMLHAPRDWRREGPLNSLVRTTNICPSRDAAHLLCFIAL